MNMLADPDPAPGTRPELMPQQNPLCYDEFIDAYGLSDNKAESIFTKYLQEKELKPWQAELIKLQQHLEKRSQRMIILFEGRDAAAKGGTIRCISRYMNEKHYRVIAMGKASEEQRSQWYFKKTLLNFRVVVRSFCLTVAGITGRWSSLYSVFARRKGRI